MSSSETGWAEYHQDVGSAGPEETVEQAEVQNYELRRWVRGMISAQQASSFERGQTIWEYFVSRLWPTAKGHDVGYECLQDACRGHVDKLAGRVKDSIQYPE